MSLKARYKSNSKKRVLRFIMFYSFLALFLIIHSAFAKYTIISEGTPKIEIANWKIKVNNNNLQTEQIITNVIELIPDATTQTTTNNKLAPGKKGNFEILINPQETDVSIEYIISFDTSKLPEGLGITSYEIIEDGIINNFDNVSIKGEIILNENLQTLTPEDSKTIKVYWEWLEDEQNIPSATENYNIIASISVKQKI